MESEGLCDDSIFEKIISGDYTTKRMYIKSKADLYLDVNLGDVCAWTAEELIGSINDMLDNKVAYGMTYILLNSIIIYGKIGEQFLQHKLKEFSQESYSLLIAEKMLRHYHNEKRKNDIIQGIKDVFNDKDNIYANAVKAAILSLVYFVMREYEMSDDVEDRFFNNIIIPFEEVQRLIAYKNYGNINQEVVLSQLEIVYTYLLTHEEEIYSEFKEYFSDFTKDKLIIYYIANGDIKDLNYIMQQIENSFNF